jgi:hypothetical protein
MAREDLATAADLACPKCHMFGCDCVTPPRPAVHVCPVCRRSTALCICRSHVVHTPALEGDDGFLLAHGADTPTARIESAVRELKHYWYDTRDAAAAERLVRDLASKVYRA